ncbi:UNVERIFIED_CONTAM: hypothetical protein ABIE34_001394 [Jeotgalibacillus campisalis]
MASLIPTPFVARAAPSNFALHAGIAVPVASDVTIVRTSGTNQSARKRHPIL